MSPAPADRAPLREREIAWLAIEIAAGIVVWVVVVRVILDSYLHWPGWLQDAVSYGGGVGVVLVIGWWRMIRWGPEGPPMPRRSRLGVWGAGLAGDAVGAGLLIGGGGALIMCIVLLMQADSDGTALLWGTAFGAIAVLQLARYIRRR